MTRSPSRVAPAVSTVLTMASLASPAAARRLFYTNDAGFVPKGSLQLKSWGAVDSASAQHRTVGAVGPIEPLELAAALSIPRGDALEIVSGVLQAKLLGRAPTPEGLPGLAGAVGTIAPVGSGSLAGGLWQPYTYLALSAIPWPDQELTLHANAGLVFPVGDGRNDMGPSWGLAAQVRLVGPLSLMAEGFSSDAAVAPTDAAAQTGLIVALGEHAQLDYTLGVNVRGSLAGEPFATLGLKLVTPGLW